TVNFLSTENKILDSPPGYVPIRTPARKLMATPMSLGGMLEEDRNQTYDLPAKIPSVVNLPFFKQEDMQHFGKLLTRYYASSSEDKEWNPAHEKDGTSTNNSQSSRFWCGPSIQSNPSTFDVAKVINRILYKFDALVRSYDEDYFARC
ncbi:16010_t:CDS:1, partial [Cetraspora pellucida]